MQYCLEHNPAEVLVRKGAVYLPAKTFWLLLNTMVVEWETGVGRGEGGMFYKGWREGKGEREIEREWMNDGLKPPWDLPRCNVKLAPIYGSWGKTKETGHSVLVGGRLNKLWKILQGLYWAAVRMVDLYTHLTNFKSLYRGLSQVQSWVSSRWS